MSEQLNTNITARTAEQDIELFYTFLITFFKSFTEKLSRWKMRDIFKNQSDVLKRNNMYI